MNPVDNNVGIRTQRTDIDEGTRRSEGGAAVEGTRGPASGAGAEGAGGGESVSFTQMAADLLSLETQLRELPDVDQERVDSIRQAIQDGSFEIDTNRIVDNLLQS